MSPYSQEGASPQAGRTDTREAILDAAESLIQKNGANGMSYTDIGRVVGIRNASIHHHFPAKDDLLKALIERYSIRFFSAVEAILASDSRGRDKLARFVELFESTLRDDGKHCLCGMLGAELGGAEHPVRSGVRRFYRRGAERLAEIFEEGRDDGSLHFVGASRDMGLLVFSLLEGALLVARNDGLIEEFQRINEQLLKTVAV